MKRELICATVLSVFLLLAGCSAGAASAPTAAPVSEPTASEENTIELNGSVSALPLMRGLAEGLLEHDGTFCNLMADGKNASMDALTGGTADLIAFEGDTSEVPEGAEGQVIAYQAVAVVVNPSCGAADLTAQQLTALFSGEITDWSQLGGSGAVTLIVPEKSDSFRQAFEDLFSLRTSSTGIKKSIVPDSALVSAQVEQDVLDTAGAIGICPAAFLENQDHIAAIDGVLPTTESLHDGTYPAARAMLLVLRTDAPRAARNAFTYCASDAADNTILASGYLPQ